MGNFENMKHRLRTMGGYHQEDTMIKDKWRSLQRALSYSYQTCMVTMAQWHDQVLTCGEPLEEEVIGCCKPVFRALINPDKVKQDYDDKILSIDYKARFGPGDVFEWERTHTHWIIYTQEITEDAYFRGEIRRCRWKIKFKDKDGNWCATWAAIRGPVETQINSIQKNQVRIDEPNLSLNILMPRNEKTLEAFERYQEFLFQDRCWRVEAIDPISMTNVLEINAEEYYIDRTTDDVENEMKNGLVIEPVLPHNDEGIEGDNFIKVKIPARFSVAIVGGKWEIVEKEVPVTLCEITPIQVAVTWNKITHGQFTLRWSKDDLVYEKTIVAESLL